MAARTGEFGDGTGQFQKCLPGDLFTVSPFFLYHQNTSETLPSYPIKVIFAVALTGEMNKVMALQAGDHEL